MYVYLYIRVFLSIYLSDSNGDDVSIFNQIYVITDVITPFSYLQHIPHGFIFI